MQRYMANFTERDSRTGCKRSEWPISYVAEVMAKDIVDARQKLFDAVYSTNPGAQPFMRSAIFKKEDYEEYKDYTSEDAKALRRAGVVYG